MALSKADLKNTIVQIMTDMLSRDTDSIDEYATRLSDAIDEYVKSATIVYQTGLTSPNGAVTGTFNGHLE